MPGAISDAWLRYSENSINTIFVNRLSAEFLKITYPYHLGPLLLYGPQLNLDFYVDVVEIVFPESPAYDTKILIERDAYLEPFEFLSKILDEFKVKFRRRLVEPEAHICLGEN